MVDKRYSLVKLIFRSAALTEISDQRKRAAWTLPGAFLMPSALLVVADLLTPPYFEAICISAGCLFICILTYFFYRGFSMISYRFEGS